ncbi:superoxide dismutase family protein [Novosphingobium sp. TH158]|uniref:superoxide dismutase family protein n=1 Tax=Novosphingobium sp. TH158 TaxID=2067455 RepID=UPI000C7A1368|nr:superoxide dismutase family protein [Novosphingobium sp. TH158]PLK27798.1 superoxide dismutase family protein [Novosphingobium sp. TH158]
MPRLLAPVAFALSIAAVPAAIQAAPGAAASAPIVSSSGTDVGYATVSVKKGKAVLSIAVTGVSEGPHGLHLHTTGKCGRPAFTDAGGHLNPGGHQHGTLNPAGSHLGDLPNLVVSASGEARGEVVLNGKPKDVMAALFDADGTAIVIHAGPDDYRTDPTGNSGGRIACGVFSRN